GQITNVETGQIQELNLSKAEGEVLRVVHRTALLKALGEELPNDAIRFSRGITSIEAQKQEGLSIAIIHMEDGATIKPKSIERKVLEHFAKDLPPLYLVIVQHTDLSTLKWAPIMFRVPWQVFFGKLSKGNITVAGDALHPVAPDLGQNECAALEDAVVMGQHIGDLLLHKRLVLGVGVGIREAFGKYVEKRKWRATGLMVMSSFLFGFVEQGGNGCVMEFFRNLVFRRCFYNRVFSLICYDCGKLPSVSSCSLELESKKKV
ncbi:hypothetical protein UlMin_037996, partial [Ulmus minor]